MSIDKLTEQIEQWSIDRDLHTADPSKQMLKVVEELGELAEGLAKNDHDKKVDGIGDLYVTLVVLSMQLKIDIRECIFVAHEEIKDRKGKMIDGIFIKQEDLE